MNTLNTITIGRTEYAVERSTADGDYFFLTGPRGGSKVAVPYINDPDTYHAFTNSGSYADLQVNGRTAKIKRADLEAAVAA